MHTSSRTVGLQFVPIGWLLSHTLFSVSNYKETMSYYNKINVDDSLFILPVLMPYFVVVIKLYK